ncbi:Tho complex subunit 7-domain-containing protein [Cristinia sonorae]|uniref:Tho complex subunit 7-domain-containing protein n=1 Tax=Cristinia sonorae TaxID=1940300 RepID=A0A8K0UKZ2_9AGAR|nr:Tho complex subunit 7-domain-containing protein [Cristinia sonorae]
MLSESSTSESIARLSSVMTPQQEDGIIHSRIINDEKALRRVTKKFHTYTGVAYNAGSPGESSSVDDARDAFLVELAYFQLSLKKSLMVCEAEARQVEEYQRERERIANDQSRLKDEIEDLKLSLEQAQLERKRKMEYDVIAEKVNALPSRDELERSIRSLENDMAAIRVEHENQNRSIQMQKVRLDMAVADLQELRLMGKPEEEQDGSGSAEGEAGEVEEISTPVAAQASADVDMTREESGELQEEKEEGEEAEEPGDRALESDEEDIPLAKTVALNAGARSFMPRGSSTRPSTPLHGGASRVSTPLQSQVSRKEEGEEDEDIEMGELAEEPRGSNGSKKKANPEDLEEGEASDLSSELSEPPDD